MEPLIFFFFWLVGIVQGILQFYFSGVFTGTKPSLRQYIILSFGFLFCYFGGAYFQSFPLSTLLNMITIYGANRLLLKNRGFISALTAILSVSISQLSFGIFNALTSLLMPFLKAGTPLSLFVGPITALLSLALFYCCCRFIALHYALEKDVANQYLFMIVTPALFLCVIGYYIVNTAYGNVTTVPYPVETGKHLELLTVQIFGLLALFSTLYAYRKLCESFRTRSRLSLLQQETQAQRTYVSEAKMRYEQTLSFRHDIQNHLSVLDGLLKCGQTEQATIYLEKLHAVTKKLSFPVQTGNPVVDILCGSKMDLAGQMGIRMEFSLVLPPPGRVDDLDLCVIFSNALDNAIHACALSRGTKMIHAAGERQGDFYLLEFENDCLPEQTAPVKIGTGLSNIKSVAEKYGGAVTMEHQAAHFYLHVLLNLQNIS